MEVILSLLAMYVVLLPLWAVIASPIFLAFFFLVRFMRRSSVRSAWAIAAVALAFSLLAAPVPTPIITVLVPHGLALLGRTYYANVLNGPEMFAELWWWIAPSLMLAFVVALVAVWRYLRSPDSSFIPNRLRGFNSSGMRQ